MSFNVTGRYCIWRAVRWSLEAAPGPDGAQKLRRAAIPATGMLQLPRHDPAAAPPARQPPRHPGLSLATRSTSAHPLPLFPYGACQGALHCCRPQPLPAPSCSHHVEATDEEAEDDPRINSGLGDAYVVCTHAPARHMATFYMLEKGKTAHFSRLNLSPVLAGQCWGPVAWRITGVASATLSAFSLAKR